jgi:phosphoribosyl 1,2-cyclic phosphodiesterase
MSDQAVTESEECSDVHFTQMNDMIAMMADATKKKVAMTHLELSNAAMKKGDAVECMTEMIEAHKAMGL